MNGWKTYALAVASIICALVLWWTGSLEAQNAMEIIGAALATIFIRQGITKNGPGGKPGGGAAAVILLALLIGFAGSTQAMPATTVSAPTSQPALEWVWGFYSFGAGIETPAPALSGQGDIVFRPCATWKPLTLRWWHDPVARNYSFTPTSLPWAYTDFTALGTLNALDQSVHAGTVLGIGNLVGIGWTYGFAEKRGYLYCDSQEAAESIGWLLQRAVVFLIE